MNFRQSLTSVVLTLFASVALAGFVQEVPVEIEFVEGGGSAFGNMRTAREAKNDLDYIGCGLRQIDNGTTQFSFGFCQAQDADGNQITCFTERASLLETMRATGDYSFITFSWSDVDDGMGGTTQECFRVGFSTQSFYLPKK